MLSCRQVIWALGLVGALALTPGAAYAQGRGGGGGGMAGMAGPGMIALPAVQKELKLSDEQTEKAKTFAEGYREKSRESMSQLEGLEPEERMKKATELNMVNAKAGMKDVEGMLKPEQTKRFKQIVFQARGVEALTDPDHSKALKITSDQADKVKNLLENQRSEVRAAMADAGGDRAAMAKQQQAIRKTTAGKALALMTPEQKEMYKEMSGEPFELPAMGGGRGGR